MIAAPVIQSLCELYFVAPEYLGTAATVEMQTVSGSLFADGRVRHSPSLISLFRLYSPAATNG